jgi:hypothetical protein
LKLSYAYAWLPVVVVVTTLVLLTHVYLALIVLIVLPLAVLGALTAAIVSVPHVLGRYVSPRWREHRAAPQHAEVLDTSGLGGDEEVLNR